uniref:Uncharacterized protein MANES_15G122100 n=1 Tax=Rhizophora mucronata TaxID=61149 RepID=A0A2P2IY14_RHIMU
MAFLRDKLAAVGEARSSRLGSSSRTMAEGLKTTLPSAVAALGREKW